ncbi:DUF3139 domain-containing protein [Amphibacillus cookii]|uniref:DUF3139 domain-containing protein n=1 Tax=Amphibacillus cookii TaxID=767787 RepID=UPI001956C674|nr:DUF3139 domain-containing protein [Amphibacillus cookii]MBM7541828.1 hypothetical protein [Amphibacillus cookii]
MRKVLIALVVLLLVGVIWYVTGRIINKTQTTKAVDEAIEEMGFSDAISHKETVFDSKTGDYEVEVIYEDEKEHLYIYYNDQGDVTGFGHDLDGNEITDTSKLKYLIDYRKPR